MKYFIFLVLLLPSLCFAQWLSITGVDNNRVSSYAKFDTEQEAASHALEHNGLVYDNSANNPVISLFVDGQTITVAPVDRSQEKLKRLKSEAINALIVEQNEALLDAARLKFQADPNDPTLPGVVKGYFQAEQNQ